MGIEIDLQLPPLPEPGEPWAVFLDIDGTLVGFADDPAQVSLDEGLLQLLGDVHRRVNGALAILSGRCLPDVDALFGSFRPPTGALHGHELRDAAGSVTLRKPLPHVAAAVEAKIRNAMDNLDGVMLERKSGVGFVLHFRSVPHQAQAAAHAAEAISRSSMGAYEVQHGDCVAELKPTGADKGTALQWLMDQAPFRTRRPVVVGDDLTDEHAFAAATALGGFGIVVGARAPTLARFRLPDPTAVREWLARLAEGSR